MTERDTNTPAGKLIVISGPSGSGKTTVCRELLTDPAIQLSVSATTRKPRPGEQDGENYFFVSREEFCGRVERGLFAEHAEYNGNLYGTPRDWLESELAAGHIVLLEIDLQGSKQLWEQFPKGTYIFLDGLGAKTQPSGSHAATPRAPKSDSGVRKPPTANANWPRRRTLTTPLSTTISAARSRRFEI